MKIEFVIPEELTPIVEEFEATTGISLSDALEQAIPLALRSFDLPTIISTIGFFIKK